MLRTPWSVVTAVGCPHYPMSMLYFMICWPMYNVNVVLVYRERHDLLRLLASVLYILYSMICCNWCPVSMLYSTTLHESRSSGWPGCVAAGSAGRAQQRHLRDCQPREHGQRQEQQGHHSPRQQVNSRQAALSFAFRTSTLYEVYSTVYQMSLIK